MNKQAIQDAAILAVGAGLWAFALYALVCFWMGVPLF